jgi:hypothetical protein
MDTPQNPLENAVLLSVSFTKLGTRRTVNTRKIAVRAAEKSGTQRDLDLRDDDVTMIEEDASVDHDMLHVSKSILKSPELKAILTHYRKLKEYLKIVATRVRFVKPGMYVISTVSVPEVDARVEKAKGELTETLVPAFRNVYPGLIQEAKEKLGPLFDPGDYPPIALMERAFTISTEYVAVSVPDALQRVAPEIFRREMEKEKGRIQSAVAEITEALTEELATFVTWLADRTGDDPETGKRKAFKAPALEKMQLFLSVADQKNLSSNEKLTELIGKAREVMSGVDLKALRKDKSVRQYISGQMSAIRDQMVAEGMIEIGSRMIADDDDDNGEEEAA